MTDRPNHRSHGAETAMWTAKALALYGWADEIVLLAPLLTADAAGYAEFRATLKQLLTRWAGASGKFIGVSVLGEQDGAPTARILSRTYTGEEWIWKLAAEPLNFEVLCATDVSTEPPIEVAKRLLAEPLGGVGCAEDVQLKITEPYLIRHEGRWLLDYGRPWWDEKGHRLTGIQQARERAWMLDQEDQGD